MEEVQTETGEWVASSPEVEGGSVLKGAVQWAVPRQRMVLGEAELFSHWPETTVSFPVSLQSGVSWLRLWLLTSLEFRTKLTAKSSWLMRRLWYFVPR